MTSERENTLQINLSASTDGLPKVSFAASGDTHTNLTSETFNISGNDITAYYDGAHKLVFVLDKTISESKPNILLIINPVGDRKWDDILANDFDLNLETVRPKKDNKYQKLDIEYSGLSVYNKLINDFKSDADLKDAKNGLDAFRDSSMRRAAKDRLIAANETIVKTADTITKTNDTLNELQLQIKKLREKLSKQKKEIGKEPTKQSAAKILKTESQIEHTNEKLKRAKKRLSNANKRLDTAKEDAQISKNLLAQKEITFIEPVKELTIEIKEPKAKVMAEEVKPLFDQDPKIMDDKIAFKPIEFNVNINTAEPTPVVQEIVTPVVPPVTENIVVPSPVFAVTPEPISEPVFIPTPSLNIQPVPEIKVVPSEIPLIRPISPVLGDVNVSNVSSVSEIPKHRPTALYYIMLLVLIVLSVFTLWIYQKNTGNKVPDLTVANAPEQVQENTEITQPSVDANVETPFLGGVSEPETVAAPVPVEQPVQPVVQDVQPVVSAQPTFVEPEPVVPAQPVIQEQPAAMIDNSQINNEVPSPEYRQLPPSPELVQPVPETAPKPEYDVSGTVTYDYQNQQPAPTTPGY